MWENNEKSSRGNYLVPGDWKYPIVYVKSTDKYYINRNYGGS